MNEHYEKWNQFAPFGLLLIGLGISIVGDAVVSKSRRKGWFFKGTFGLIIVNAGVAIFGESVKARALYEWKLEQLRKQDEGETHG